jgi:TRAP-type C4-dicarboxylate transport system permease small subunit
MMDYEMNIFLHWILNLSRWSQVIAGVALTGIMGVTVTDVILRAFGRPIVGSYEIVALLGALVVAFSLPFTSWVRGHIFVDVLVQRLPRTSQKAIHFITRSLGMLLFFFIAWNLFKMGLDLKKSGEVSPTLQIPFYPVVYGVGIACILLFLVLLGDLVKLVRGKYE